MAFRKNKKLNNDFSRVTISLASPESILDSSHGEVTQPETINYRTYKPEMGGLFCERIFGPVKDWECHCGKYKRIRYKGIICDRCGVEVTEKKVRRERMGHIELVVPVAHIWYFKSLPNKIGYLLGLPTKKLDQIVYYERYAVVNPGIKAEDGLQYLDFLTEDEYLDIMDKLPKDNQMLDDDDPNKFIAKIASDWNKPDGLFVVRPSQVERFLTPLPVGRIPGVGKVMEKKLADIGVATVGDLRAVSLDELQARFGSFGAALYRRGRGIDERAVEPDQLVQSISAEDTFSVDLPLRELGPAIDALAAKAWTARARTGRVGHTVVLKLKTTQFRILTRSHTPATPPATLGEFTAIAQALRDRVDLPDTTRYRLAGVGLSGFRDRDESAAQAALFPRGADT